MRKAKNNSEKSDYQKFAERTQRLAKKLADDGTILDPFAGFLVDTGNRFPGKKNR